MIKISGVTYKFDKSKPQILKRGIIDAYDLSSKSNEWVVLSRYIFWSAELQRVIIVPNWFNTDLSSIPKALRWIISVNERHRIASLPHDFLYRLGSEYTFSQKHADKVLREFCELMGVPSWKVNAIYWGVRMGGWASFNRGKKMFIEKSHRIFYKNALYFLQLELRDGHYLQVNKG